MIEEKSDQTIEDCSSDPDSPHSQEIKEDKKENE